MADSLKLDILRALTAHLEGITPENGYSRDLAGRVFRGRAIFGAQDPVPALSILEAPRPTEAQYVAEDATLRAEDWVLLIQGWAEDDRQNPTDPAYQLMAEVERRLSDIMFTRHGVGQGAAYRLGGRIGELLVTPGICRPPDQISSRAYFYLPCVVKLAFDIRAPFAAD
jgi:hypothetical protein